MTHHTFAPGRPLPAALALGFAGAGTACLLTRELLLVFCGATAALGFAALWLPLAMAAGLILARRHRSTLSPSERLAMGLLALAISLPIALSLPRLLPPLTIDSGFLARALTVLGTGLTGFGPLGLCLGAGLAWTDALEALGANRRKTGLRLPLAAGAVLGALFIQFVALPKLSPLNACLDMGLGCAAAALVCNAGSSGGRRLETWLSLLALGFVMLLPISGVIENWLAAWQWHCPVAAVPATPPAGDTATDPMVWARALLLPEALAALLAVYGKKGGLLSLPAETVLAAAAGLAEAGALGGILAAFAATTGDLFARLPLLVGTFLAGETLALYAWHKRGEENVSVSPAIAALLGAALGLGLLSALLAL